MTTTMGILSSVSLSRLALLVYHESNHLQQREGTITRKTYMEYSKTSFIQPFN